MYNLRIHFPGAVDSVFTTKLEFDHPAEKPALPTYRIIDSDGKVIEPKTKPDVSQKEVLKWYDDMLTGMFISERNHYEEVHLS